jgi:hypothetical protein
MPVRVCEAWLILRPLWRANALAMIREQVLLETGTPVDEFRYEDSMLLIQRECAEIKQLVMENTESQPLLTS